MTDVRGLPLSEAENILKNEGYNVVCSLVRSKKGVPEGSDERVVRVRLDEAENTVFLAYSVFKTTV